MQRADTFQQPTRPETVRAGSRRRRLWELGSHAHCPVIGVCLPIGALRRLTDKVLGVTDKVPGAQALAGDHELHCGAIAECRLRTRLAEALQKELDRRHAPALRRAATLKTTDALAAWWREAAAGPDLAGRFWAVMTHARCDDALAHAVLGDVHMLQHQIGMATRVDAARFDALIDENAVLARELGAVQQRATRLATEQARRIAQLDALAMQLRAELIGRDTTIAQLREQLAALEAAAPELRTRFELARENRALAEQVHALQRQALQARQDAERQRRRADEALALQAPDAVAPPAAATASPLHERAVLCVGGRSASVPAYRRLIERTGGRFLHHDGGEEGKVAQLDATLAAADLVICQTGCISHDAYWRVKDHCKRTGKRCVFVSNPSSSALERSLIRLMRAGAPDASAADGRVVELQAATADEAQALK
ncbi:DUF2325 domain-containing protein [Aquabacterium humicola]|uniref:DUF2325 domain-containing protein n=1 Tax=Aquabacterium humicola TaxID=3237377 RepID=UPI00254327E0|nr:DUF2325 domain-containing protein [Rubrivivax pictus]